MKTIVEEKEQTSANDRPSTAPIQIVWRLLDFLIAAVFIFAGLTKILDMDHLVSDLSHFRFPDLLTDIRHLSLSNPVGFARDVDNYKLLPWPIAVALGFYLPWLEIFSGLALIFRRLYSGSLVILTALTVTFIIASSIAKARGLDISCGCFGHISKGWSFGWHLALDFAILTGLIALWFVSRRNVKPQQAPSHPPTQSYGAAGRDGLQFISEIPLC